MGLLSGLIKAGVVKKILGALVKSDSKPKPKPKPKKRRR